MSTGEAMAKAMEAEDRRRRAIDFALLAALGAVIVWVFLYFGVTVGLGFLAAAACHVIFALGLTMQWGYAGLFNAGVLGFIALGAFGLVFISAPVEPEFWASDAPGMLAAAFGAAAAAALGVWALGRYGRGVSPRVRRVSQAILLAAGAIAFVKLLGPAATAIEAGPGFIGGLGLPPLLGWLFGGVLAAVVAYGVGRACLGLRSDYLAIATLGAAEIIRAVLKNEDWLTRGTLTVSPLPWPTPEPEPGVVSVELARAGYTALLAVVIALIYLAMLRAYRAPWGRMIRAIRDDEDAAWAMGKDVDGRRLQIFVLGCALMGVGGAAFAGLTRIFDPSAYVPLNNTFLIWVMVIVGGAGSNVGAVFGATLVYALWVVSEPLMTGLFHYVEIYGRHWFEWEPPADFGARAVQMRIFLMGLVIALALRFAPRGLFPERPPRID